jgi:hypothetical protein
MFEVRPCTVEKDPLPCFSSHLSAGLAANSAASPTLNRIGLSNFIFITLLFLLLDI